MYAAHLIYNLIKPEHSVLDVGGASQPFRRANSVIDIMPYHKRYSDNAFLKNIPESFTEKTWHIQDICDSSKPFPFKDKEFDFVVCGHTLEDIRDPMYVVREMSRVGKAGYIEVPSRYAEQLMGMEMDNMVGYAHHRWVVDISQDKNKRKIKFIFKNHKMHFDSEMYISKPRRVSKFPYMNQNHEILGILWKGQVQAEEDVPDFVLGDSDFFRKTAKMAKKLGRKLWNQKAKFPVELDNYTLKEGITLLSELKNITNNIMTYDENRNLTDNILEYEKKL